MQFSLLANSKIQEVRSIIKFTILSFGVIQIFRNLHPCKITLTRVFCILDYTRFVVINRINRIEEIFLFCNISIIFNFSFISFCSQVRFTLLAGQFDADNSMYTGTINKSANL